MEKGWLVSVFLLLILPLSVFAEGTRQILPFADAAGRLCIDKSRNDFGFYDASPEFRINISIAGPGEKILFGFGSMTSPVPSAPVQFRIKDPAGNVVMGPGLVPFSGTGYIATYEEAVAGPLPASGGYSPFAFSPSAGGDYCLEFYYPPDSAGVYHEAGSVHFKYFDITVADAGNAALTGRVWSKAWQFFSGKVITPPTLNRFWATMYILSDDSIVTSVNCNGFVGGIFSFSSNQTGCGTTGNITDDRRSHTGFHTYPQYKVFLADPDSTLFPTGMAQAGIRPPVTVSNDCPTGAVDFGVQVNLDGIIEILLDVNPNPGEDPEDVVLTGAALAHPGGTGYNTIHWDGIDGKGNPVPSGRNLTATFRFIHGITHLPIYDIEYNDNGYKVEVVRPQGPSPPIYWDDSMIPFESSVNLAGCIDAGGCHLWTYDHGDTNTINSWWYVVSPVSPTINLVVKRTPLDPGPVSGDSTPCLGTGGLVYAVAPDSNASSYSWTYSGTGATITGNLPSATVSFTSGATNGTLSVTGYNAECGSGPTGSLPLELFPLPQVSLAAFDTVCFNDPPFQLAGGSPPGGQYLVNGVASTAFDPNGTGTGDQRVVYRYTDGNECTSRDSSIVYVRDDSDCDKLVWIPNAFSPDGDGLNDIFRPTLVNIREFRITLFDRSGQEVFQAEGLAAGWDGMCGGSPCPTGTYTYMAVYESSVSPKKYTTLTGWVNLIR